MKDITEFKAWLNKEISQYPLIAKSNPLSLNELCYVLRLSGKDFAVCWNNDSGFSCIPSIAESYIPSRDLSLKVKLVDYDSADESEDIEGCLRVEIIRKVIRSSADIEKALEDWGRELTVTDFDSTALVKPEQAKRGYTKPDHEVNVRGHLRRYKSGKVVWVKPSVKYIGKSILEQKP